MSTPSDTRPAPSAALTGRFEPGNVLDDRYRIIGPLRAGRLDEAYQAEDVDTGQVIALRVLRRDSLPITPDRSLARTKRRLVALEHPNVARVHDVSVHTETLPDGSIASALFATSELVDGEPLGSFVRNERPLERSLALSLIDGICAGLSAIHRKGLVHGDLNSAAITIVRQGSSLQPVLTDFAFPAAGGQGSRSIGSPVYRAPETIVGRPPDKTSDVFSLGVVIYEILSGRIPFTGGNLLALDFRRLEEEPRSLRGLVDDLDPVLEKVVSRCLSRGAEDRYANAEEVRQAIRGRDVWTPRTRRNVGTLSAAAALVIVMLGGSALLDRVSELERRRMPIEVAGYRPSFAILDVAPLGHSTEPWVGVALSELIRAEFSADSSLRVANPDLVREYAGLSIPIVGAPDPDLAAGIRTLFDVEAIVIGTCATDRGGDVPTVALDLCVIDARSGETIAAAFERGSPDGLPELAARASSRIRAAIDLPQVPGRPRAWEPDAVRPWAEGLLLLRARDYRAAVEALEVAGDIQPSSAPIQDARALAWSRVGSALRGADAARLALDSSERAPTEQILQRMATLALLEGRLSRATDERYQLARAFPDRVSHVYNLIETLLVAGATRPAAEEIRRLRTARATVDPRTEIADARLHSQIGRFEEAAIHADRGAAIAELVGSSTLQGEALLERAWAEAAVGNDDRALDTLSEAETLLGRSIDSSGITRAASIRADILRRRGNFDEAIDVYIRLGETFQSTGEDQNYATTLGSRATILSLEGKHHEALTLLEDAIARFGELGDEMNLVRSLGVSGGELLALGRLEEARGRYRSAAEIARRSDLAAWEGYAQVGLARVDLERLDLRSAAQEIERASTTFDSISLGSATAGLDVLRSELDRLRGRLGDAESRLTGIVTSERETLDRARQAELHLALARIAVSSGKNEMALALAERASEHFASIGNLDREAECLTIAHRAASALGDRRAVRMIAARLDTLTPRIESPLTLYRIRLARAAELEPERARDARLDVHAYSAEAGLRLLQIQAARELRRTSPGPSEQARWDAEISDLVRRSGASLFLAERD